MTAVSQTSAGGVTELTLGLSGDAVFSLFTLTEPYRVVIDLPPFAWRAAPVAPGAMPGIVAIRHGLFRHDSGRVVIELDRPLAVRRAGLVPVRGGFALRLGLAPVSRQAFAASAGWPENARWQAGAPTPIEGSGEVLVAIDPGHGGIDPGTAHGDLVEKDLALAFGRSLAQAVARRPGLSAFLTRVDDRYIPLRQRVKLARQAGAHVFVSLHADSLAAGEADGVSIYTLSAQGTDSAAAAFAERENRSDVLAGVNLAGSEDDVTRLLIELARRGSKSEAIKLAESIVGALSGRVALLPTRPHRRGNFFVLKAPDLPSVLVELGFLSSPVDRARLVDPAWRAQLAEGIAEGIADWVDVASPGFLVPRG
ncbi:N-acetylmuramoyl-L-alanine amidase [Paralimibaculum aggregatum]|uniref:N-acetylmuramoyl-L-alanine amidase n=1 Tax=Paralimibaculum aggregatum TaxID=3036245 RepID=UPI002552DBDB|nr:N-acetylmuramoyl-L-alanine amidase [Limibaculum sp. NKW23]